VIQSLLLNPITSRVLTYAAIALSGFIAGYALSNRINAAAIERLRAQYQADLRAISEKAREIEERNRALEAQMRQAADKARKELDDALREIQDREVALAGLRRDRDALRVGLRNALAAYASGSGTADSLAACRARAGALAAAAADGAELLAEGAGLLEQAALAHDRRAAEVKALIEAWPQSK
jgi:chromosome segregation ATPase